MSTKKPFGVGIIGASAERGWAKESHVPAVQRLAGLELAAVAMGSQPPADAAARAFDEGGLRKRGGLVCAALSVEVSGGRPREATPFSCE